MYATLSKLYSMKKYTYLNTSISCILPPIIILKKNYFSLCFSERVALPRQRTGLWFIWDSVKKLAMLPLASSIHRKGNCHGGQ